LTKSSENIVDEYLYFLQLNDWKRLKEVKSILDFDIAGEDNNKILLYFLLLSNYHKNLMTFILYRGDSSAGKNYVVENVLKLFPKKDVYIFDSATAKALNYDQDIKNKKIIYLRELEYHQSTIELLKGLYNPDGRVHKETIQDKETKAHYVKEHLLKRKGIITTFSFENIQIDVINRGWVLTPDQSFVQTQKIIKFDIASEKNLIERKLQKKEMDNRCFFISQCVQSLDFDFEVFIPYVEKLEVLLPSTQLNVRRDKNKLFDLIKIITLWNQKNRQFFEIGEEKYLLAEYTDLKMALGMCQDLFVNLVLHLDDTKKSILDFMEEFVLVDVDELKLAPILDNYGGSESSSRPGTVKEQDVKYTITQLYEEIQTFESISRKTVKRKMDDLFYEGYLLREKEGGKYFYSKLKDYNLVNILDLDNIQEEIDSIVEQTYIYYSNKTKELLSDEEVF